MPFCPKCNDHAWSLDRHVCPNTWRIYYEEYYGDGFDEVVAQDAELAVTKWADKTDCESSDYLIIGGAEPTVTVTDAYGENPKQFVVSGESQAVYYAREVSEP